jgi:hypothetical protein
MRVGDLATRLLTAIVVHDLYDAVLAHGRARSGSSG